MRAPPWLVFALCLCAARSARAQSDDEAAEYELRRAVERCRRGEYDRALASFRQALDRARSARAIAEMGLCEQRARRWVDAEDHLLQSLNAPDAWVTEHRGSLELALNEVSARVGRLALIGGAEGAELRVNGEVVGALPMNQPLRLASGRVRLEATLRGWRPWRRELDLAGGGTTHENVVMERDEDPAPRVAGAPTVRCPAGLVARDGLCYAPEGYRRGRSGIRPGQVTMIVGGSVAAVAGVVALALGVEGNSAESDFVSRCGGASAPASCVSERESLQSDLDGRATAVNAMIAVAGVGVAAAIVGLIVDQTSARPSPSRFSLSASGVTLRW